MALLPATLLLMILGVYVVRSERKLLMVFVIVSVSAVLLTIIPADLSLADLLSRNGSIST